MHWSFLIQKIVLLGGCFLLGIIAPWWIFFPIIIMSMWWRQIGPEIFFITMALDVVSGGHMFIVGYSFVALCAYIGIYGIQNILLR